VFARRQESTKRRNKEVIMKFKCANIAILILFIAFLSAGCGSSGGGGDSGAPTVEEDSGLTVAVCVSADPTSIVANGTSTSTITAIAKTDTGEGVWGIEVSFVADNGSITASGITDVFGKATATLTSSTQQGVATVTASVGSISGTTTVTFSDSGASTISVLADQMSIVADGTSTSTITATVKTATGQGVPDIKVEFGTDNGSITASGITDSEGKATATLTSSTQQGVANVIASVGSISGTTTVTFVDQTTLTVAEISVSADPTSIVANGTSTSTITAIVKTATGQGVPDIEVSFGTDNGSITASGITDGEGKATATLTSSTQQGVL
jgi:adhesin/invasin